MKKASGFTIIELMVIMAILAITLAFGVPQINNVVTDNRRVDALNRVSANLAYARSEAIKRSTPISVAAIAPPNWDQGWTVYNDTDGDLALTAGEELRVEGSLNLPPTTTITSCDGCGDIIFNPDGSVNAAVTLQLVDTKVIEYKADRDLNIDSVGRVNITKVPYP